MTSPQAILAGAALIAVTILLTNSINPAQAQRVGPFQLMHHSNTQANAGVFRLDTATGEVTYCFITPEGGLTCTREK